MLYAIAIVLHIAATDHSALLTVSRNWRECESVLRKFKKLAKGDRSMSVGASCRETMK